LLLLGYSRERERLSPWPAKPHRLGTRTLLFVVRPHPEDLHRSRLWQDLIDEPVLDVDSSRVSTREIADELLEPRRLLPGIRSKDFEEFVGLFA
jgi:hypothetical protein